MYDVNMPIRTNCDKAGKKSLSLFDVTGFSASNLSKKTQGFEIKENQNLHFSNSYRMIDPILLK